jgi:site-specific DNA-methyltransferase (cytosine-N4-specific)
MAEAEVVVAAVQTADHVASALRADNINLAARLKELARTNRDYWSFIDNAKRDYVHGLFQYPAMMVPRLQRELMTECMLWDPEMSLVYDPFVGSGTVMTEAMILGLDFHGTDVNPLAILLCKAKSGTFDVEDLKRSLPRIMKRVCSDTSEDSAAHFPNRDKWFHPTVSTGLSRLHRAIAAERAQDIRRFWWVTLAETARLSSNSRTSTYKLHERPASELVTRRPDAILAFDGIAMRNLKALEEQHNRLSELSLLKGNSYAHSVSVEIADVRDSQHRRQADLLVTSPPYGDNHTTVPYGQHSYLPLQWINLEDIERGCNDDCLSSTHEIDARSLGGSRRNSLSMIGPLGEKSASFQDTATLLTNNRDASVRLSAFVRDLDLSLPKILAGLKDGGVMIWTMGDRRVGGVRVPMAKILEELLLPHAEFISAIDRPIPTNRKRMAPSNAAGATMASETILVMLKKPVRS